MAAPKDAPAEAPKMSGETMGLRNRPWYDAPEMASAEPISSAAMTRGRRIFSTMLDAEAGHESSEPMPKNLAARMPSTSVGGTLDRPTPSPAMKMKARAAPQARASKAFLLVRVS